MEYKKRRFRRNLMIIYCSMLVILMFLGFYIADRNIRKTSFADTSGILELKETVPFVYEMHIKGSNNKYLINLSFLSIFDNLL